MGDQLNSLFYGDNLTILREHIADESVDLIYLDQPFNSNRSYNVLFKTRSGEDSQAQVEAFDDTWTWSQQAEELYAELTQGGAPAKVADALEAMRRLLGDNDVLAYIVMMTGRLVELHRVLKTGGALWLHCDDTASHYLKIVLDAIAGPDCFRNEVIWVRSHGHTAINKLGRVHDVLLVYSKGPTVTTWNQIFVPYERAYIDKYFTRDDEDGRGPYWPSDLTAAEVRRGESGESWRGFNPTDIGRHWAVPGHSIARYQREHGTDISARTVEERLDLLDEAKIIYWPGRGSKRPQVKRYLADMPGRSLDDVWDDIPPINPRAAERLGYPTQKPLTLLERIIEASSIPGDVVLDPFCGCGTTIDAAEKLGRRWVGIDITYLAVDLIDKRLRATHGEEIADTYKVHGIPQDLGGAKALFEANPFDFERWAVSLVDGQPNQKQVGDRGVDGVIRFPIDNKQGTGRALVSVKGGAQNPGYVRDLAGTVQHENADLGVYVCLKTPTKGMIEAANHSGSYSWPVDGRSYPRVQILTIEELLDGERPNMPTPFLPYIKARKLVKDNAPTLFD